MAVKTKRVKLKERPLTAMQNAFVKWAASAECFGKDWLAMQKAGYKGDRPQLHRNAHIIMLNPRVRDAVHKARDKELAKAIKETDITIAKVLRDLEASRIAATEAGQHTAAIRAAELQGKYLKMFTERIEHVQTMDDVSIEQLAALLHEITSLNNVNLNSILAGNGADNSGIPDTARNNKPH